jgi:hypothetical protein
MDWDMRRQGIADTHFAANLGIGIFFALVFTLIFLMIEQGVTALRQWLSKPIGRESVIPELLDDGGLRRGISLDRRPRIGK